VTVPAVALVAWRWWLNDRTAARAHEAAMRAEVVKAEEATLRGLPSRVSALEMAMKDAAWRK
jgi:hypothetical protein